MYMYVLQGLKCTYMVLKIIQHIYVTLNLHDMYMSFKDILYDKYVVEESICCLTMYAI